MKVLLRTSLDDSERGRDAAEFLDQLMKIGVDVYVDPVMISPPIQGNIASLLTRLYPQHFDLSIHYLPPNQSGIPNRFKNKSNLNVLWTWHDKSVLTKRDIKDPLINYDAVLCQDQVTIEAINRYIDSEVFTGLLTPGYVSKDWKSIQRDWYSPFIFGMVLTGSKKENPELVIQAFHDMRSEFTELENAELLIKTTPEDTLNLALEENVPGLTILKHDWIPAAYKHFFKKVNCMIYADSGGVRNKSAEEYMSTGGFVIATNWGINNSWLSRSYSWALKYDLVNNIAQPDVYNLRQIMLDAVRSDKISHYGKIASDALPGMYDWSAVVDQMFSTLKRVGDKGAQLYNKYRSLPPVEED